MNAFYSSFIVGPPPLAQDVDTVVCDDTRESGHDEHITRSSLSNSNSEREMSGVFLWGKHIVKTDKNIFTA